MDTEGVGEVLDEVIIVAVVIEDEEEVLEEGGVEGGVREKGCWEYMESGIWTA